MNPTRVLIVDDEESFTRLLRKSLELTGRYVVRAENRPFHALAAARDFDPDIILLDVMMPGMDGGQVASCLQATPKFKRTPIVFLTAAVKPEEVTKNGGLIGGFPYLAKPVDVRQIIHAIEANRA